MDRNVDGSAVGVLRGAVVPRKGDVDRNTMLVTTDLMKFRVVPRKGDVDRNSVVCGLGW